MELYRYFPGSVPVVVNIPHAGTYVPGDLEGRLTEAARKVPDTDWHVDRLYEFVKSLGVHLMVATHSRYVVDLNRPTDKSEMYPGLFNTGVCPLQMFDGKPIYLDGKEPDELEIQQRIVNYWKPYHRKLAVTLQQLQDRHERVVLFDAHSIRSEVPKLFDGKLPDFNIGTADGASCDEKLTGMLANEILSCEESKQFTSVINGRFKGGFNTRHYGKPREGVHAIQMEMAQKIYMYEEQPYTYHEEDALDVQGLLSSLMEVIVRWCSHHD